MENFLLGIMRQIKKMVSQYIVIGSAILFLSGCATSPPNNINNACSIVQQYPSWYYDAEKSYKKWGVPVNTQLAIIYKESSFKADVKPPRKKLLGFIPWSHITTASGYSQAVDGTWDMYKKATGNSGASRSSFEDSVDFIGWYGNYISKRTGVSKSDTYMIYMAYYLGPGAVRSGSYKRNKMAKEVSGVAQKWANKYASQLKTCKIPSEGWW
ncbi:MAG: hypothetical protein ACJA0H_000725 [Francisellaceae bacterium]|jgi:hypothetical protein